MSAVDFTTPEQVRALLGVSSDELDDDTVNLEVYAIGLDEEIRDVNVALPASYVEINEIDDESRTDAQRRLWRLTRQFATYALAKSVGGSLSMFGPKSVSDGKASISRFAGDPYKATLATVSSEYDVSRTRLVAAYADYSSSGVADTPRSYFLASAPISDPVTGN